MLKRPVKIYLRKGSGVERVKIQSRTFYLIRIDEGKYINNKINKK